MAPEMVVPFLRHWYESGVVPLAVTEKVTDSPTTFVALDGCPVTEGAVQVVTVSETGVPGPTPTPEIDGLALMLAV